MVGTRFDPPSRADSICSEMRIAVTMNGGVSLAVYIGGAAHELNRLTREDGGYATLVRTLGYSSLPVIDVITGTSAGGINGAALAVAQAYVDGDLDSLKSLWIRHGQIGDLFRQPFRKGPASLLKGDEHLLPRIQEALAGVTRGINRAMLTDEVPRPIDLTITTTMLEPVYEDSVDDLGTPMVQPQFAGLFSFRSKREDEADGAESVDDFHPDNVQRTIAALSIAARASAGYPMAFEPTFIPVDYPNAGSGDRADLGNFANWRKKKPNPSSQDAGYLDRSRFAVDGGVLANTPTQPALQAIRRHQAANNLIRRVLILVHPHATEADSVVDQASAPGNPPTLMGGLAGVARASSSVGSRTYVNEIHQHNELAHRWRDGRQTAMAQFPRWVDLEQFLGGGPGAAADQKEVVWSLIRSMRIKRSAYVMASNLSENARVQAPFGRLVHAATKAVEIADCDDEGLAFLPKYTPVHETFGGGAPGEGPEWRWGLDLAVGIASLATDLLRAVIEQRSDIDVSPALRGRVIAAASSAWTNAVNAGISLDKIGQRNPIAREAPSADIVDRLAGIVEKRLDGYWPRMCPTSMPAAVRRRLDQGAGGVAAAAEPLERDGAEVQEILRGVAKDLLNVLKLLSIEQRLLSRLSNDSATEAQPSDCAAAANSARPVGTLLGENPLQGLGFEGSDADNSDAVLIDRLLIRMLSIEVLSCLFTEHRSTDSGVPTSPIEFLQLSAQVPQHFAERFTSDDKLAGMSLSRFGAFLKRSWRANDWIWGRLDAIKLLMQVLLTPEVIRDLSNSLADAAVPAPNDPMEPTLSKCDREAAVLMDKILVACFAHAGDIGEMFQDKQIELLRQRASQELADALGGSDKPLTAVASLAAYGLQIEVANEDVPWLAATVRDDHEDGATGAESAGFLHRYASSFAHDGERTATDKLRLLRTFVEARIGQEGITSQLPSDLIIRTGATAAATVATALSSDRAGLGFVGPAARIFRGVAAVPYWVLIGLTHRGQLARTAAAGVLALGVALTAVSLVVPLPGLLSPLISTLGLASLITVFVYAALRTQSVSHGAALLALMIPLVAIACARIVTTVERTDGKQNDTGTAGALPSGAPTIVLLCVAALIIWVIIVANIGHTILPPRTAIKKSLAALRAAVERQWQEHPRRTLLIGGAAVLILAIAAALLFSRDVRDPVFDWWRAFLRRSPWNDQLVSPITFVFLAIAGWGLFRSLHNSGKLLPRKVTDGSTEHQVLRHEELADPAGLATAWCWIYGLLYIGLGVVLVPLFFDDRPPGWAIAASITSVAIGVVFSVVAVDAIPYARERRLIKQLASVMPTIALNQAELQLPKAERYEIMMHQALARIGDRSTYLVEPHPKANTDPPLSKAGRRILASARALIDKRELVLRAASLDAGEAAATTLRTRAR